jgi:p-cumate 2,3-dioxygenase ferredoxin reductase subunit
MLRRNASEPSRRRIITLQAGWTVFNIRAIEEYKRCGPARFGKLKVPLAATAEKIVIVGAGQAGGRAAEALRAGGFRGSLTMVGAERHAPYERPQLSKQLLQEADASLAYIKPAGDWASVLDVDLVTGIEITDGNAGKRVLSDRAGREFAFDRLLIATGTEPRRLAPLDDAGARVHYLRNAEDAMRLRPHLHGRARVVVVGGGVIGLEAASAAAKLGCRVTIVENADRLLARAFPRAVSEAVEARHRRHGVAFCFGVTVEAATPEGVRLTDQRHLPADIILVGVGVAPSSRMAESLGLASAQGIEVDGFGRTANEHVYCAGDVALQWSKWHGRRTRIETWANAQNHSICVARNMIGEMREYADPPWFWSDQYDLNIQVVGDLLEADEVVRGDARGDRFSVAALRDGEMVGAASLNAQKDMAIFRRLVANRTRVDKSDLASPAFDLRRALKNN